MGNNQNKYDTPMNVVQKEGDMYRGMLNAKKSIGLRIVTIVVAFILFLIPGCIAIALSVWALTLDSKSYQAWLGLIVGAFVSLVGLKIIFSNLFAKK